MVGWITTGMAAEYIHQRFTKMGISPPARSTVSRWFRKGYIRTHPHRIHSFWTTTHDWIDEAIMWRRIPPKNGRPPVAKEVECGDHVLIQEKLL
jgi:hypothetical protein